MFPQLLKQRVASDKEGGKVPTALPDASNTLREEHNCTQNSCNPGCHQSKMTQIIPFDFKTLVG